MSKQPGHVSRKSAQETTKAATLPQHSLKDILHLFTLQSRQDKVPYTTSVDAQVMLLHKSCSRAISTLQNGLKQAATPQLSSHKILPDQQNIKGPVQVCGQLGNNGLLAIMCFYSQCHTVFSCPTTLWHTKLQFGCRWGDAQSPLYGDIHFYDYNADSFDAATYPHARFVSEFGFQSLPSWQQYQRVTEPQDWHWNSTMSQFR